MDVVGSKADNSDVPTRVDEHESWQFELVPLLELPEVDLGVSVKARLRRFRPLHELIIFITAFQVPFFFGYIAYLGIVVAVFFVKASLGRVLATIGAMLGLPTVIFGISTFRYDLVAVLLRTYDVWFFSVTSTVVSVLAGLVFRDARSLVMVTAWLSFFMNVFVDANLFAFREVWIATAISIAGYIAMGATLSTGFVDQIDAFDVFSANGHTLPAVPLVRDGIFSLIILIVRNLYRRYRYALTPMRTASNTEIMTIRCVTFRCRLQLRPLHAHIDSSMSNKNEIRTTASSVSSSKTRMVFSPFLDPVDARNSLIPAGWIWKLDPLSSTRRARLSRYVFSCLGGLCFFIPSAVIITTLLAPNHANKLPLLEITILTTTISTILVGVCISTAQRQLLRAVMTSFDFIFVAFQGTYIHLAAADLCGWNAEIAVALLSVWIWSAWMLCWDAVPTPARQRLGVTSRFAAYIGTGIVTIINVCAGILILVLPPTAVHDRVFFRLQFQRLTVEFRNLSAYVSCATTIVTWAIRIMWRLWFATETELVVLDGPVVFVRRSRRADDPRPLDRRSLTGRAPKIADLRKVSRPGLSERAP